MPTIPNQFASSTVAKSSEVNENFEALADAIKPTYVFPVSGVLIVDTDVSPTIIVPNAVTIEKVFAYVKTAPSGADILIDINVNGTSIWAATQANRVTIPDGASDQAYSQTSFDTSSLSEGDLITMDIDQIGSSTAGSDLTVEIRTT